jgi:hypothetical protein
MKTIEMTQATYYQFQKKLGYPVFVRIEEQKMETRIQELLSSMGFEKLKPEELKGISFDKNQTKVLKISEANLRVCKQIDQSHALDNYGPENLTMLGNYDVYRYRNVGMMIFGDGNYFWELGLKPFEGKSNEVKVMITRFLSWALAPMGIIGFWGVPVDEGAVVMKPKEAKFESFFLDVKKGKMVSLDGVKEIEAGFQILRLDTTLRNTSRRMTKEELLSFLSTNTCYFSYHGIALSMKESLFDLISMVEGHTYPLENFQHRKLAEAS